MEEKHLKFDRYYAEYGKYVEDTLGALTGADKGKIMMLSVEVWAGFYKEMEHLSEQGDDGIRAWLYVMACCRFRKSDVPASVITGLLFEEYGEGLTERERIRRLCDICGLPVQETDPDDGKIAEKRPEETSGTE